MEKKRAEQWIKAISRQPFPVVSYELLKQLCEIAEVSYPKHSYLVASKTITSNEIVDAINFELKR